MTYKAVISELKKIQDLEKASFLQRFFKTGKGQYAEGDVFWGLSVPDQRKVARKFKDLSLPDIQMLLKSKVHEHRLTALEILVHQFEKGDEKKQKQIYDFYIKNLDRINNWDLVDASARYIAGAYLFKRNRNILYKLVKSKNLWYRRVAIVSTHYFISQNDLKDTFKISEMLLNDQEDLMHKASGWMLREAGIKSRSALMKFLDKHSKKMPRTMLRYAIEHFSPAMRKKYMAR